jgi:DNA-binding LacI/PurR family transcriptional regulator
VAIPSERIGLAAHGRYEARELARRILIADDRPTAIFAASDTQALGVMAAALEVGLQVPDDLSIIGYDDVESAEFVGLTTVRQQLFESGRQGAELLLAEIERPSHPTPVVQLSPELVVRATTAPRKEGRG